LDKETERKIGFLHMLFGAFAGVASAFSGDGGLLVGLLIAWGAMILSRSLFKVSPEEMTFKVWLGKGFYLFFVVWILLWVFAYNLYIV